MGGFLSHPVASQNLQRQGNSALGLRVGSTEMQGYRKNMEDTHSICLPLGKHKNMAFFGVYDGHGGNEASIFLSEKFPGKFEAEDDPTREETIRRVCLEADADFISSMEDEKANHGSTAVFAFVDCSNAANGTWGVTVGNIGDSRAIVVRADGTLESLTTDHKPSLPDEQKRIAAVGGTVQMDRVDGSLAMSRAIGDKLYKTTPNVPVEEQKVIPVPDVTTCSINKGDHLLLFCDGIVENLSNEQVCEFVAEKLKEIPDDPAKIVWHLLYRSLRAGSKDNHSAMMIDFNHDGNFDSYTKPDEFLPGPFRQFQKSKDFVNAYLADAGKYGYRGGELMRLTEKAEDYLPLMQNPDVPSQPDISNATNIVNGAGPPNLVQLLQLAQLARMSGYDISIDEGEGDDKDGEQSSATIEEDTSTP